jgi:hypothetical protein
MRVSRAILLLAALSLAGCHAHGGQAVTYSDRGVTVSFTRHMTSPDTVVLDIKNASAQPVCLSPTSFDPASFSIKTDQGMVQSINPPAPTTAACDTLAPGADKSQSVEAGNGFSRANIQTGRVCYRYAFSQAGPGPWQDAGTICE